MLKTLRISNLVLIEQAEIPFSPEFNVITGETGSGKSAVMSALNCVSGARVDNRLIRHGADKGVIEAFFELDNHPEIFKVLNQAGIEHIKGEELLLKRELLQKGKNRVFINSQRAHTTVLQKIGSFLFNISCQHANQGLLNEDRHLEILDQFANLVELKKKFRKAFEVEVSSKNQRLEIKKNDAFRLKMIEEYTQQIEEIETAAIKENEDEELFKEYSRLTKSEEMKQIAKDIYSALMEEGCIVPTLTKLQTSFSKLQDVDASTQDSFQAYRSARLELEEIGRTLGIYGGDQENQLVRIEEINARLVVINKIKRKYGKTLDEIQEYQRMLEDKLQELTNTDAVLESLEKRFVEAKEITDKLAVELTTKRKVASVAFAKSMNEKLSLLNMSQARFTVVFTSIARSSIGEERVQFYFAPNQGEKEIPVKECASGGELSRMMLATHTLLGYKRCKSTFIFDEIDANIGGETALDVGRMLAELSKSHQVISVTHFPQVAKYCNAHLHTRKVEKNGRTYTEVYSLGERERELEMQRMFGGKCSFTPTNA